MDWGLDTGEIAVRGPVRKDIVVFPKRPQSLVSSQFRGQWVPWLLSLGVEGTESRV